MTKPNGGSETMLSVFLRDRAESTTGSVNGYAERIGVNHSTISRWIKGEHAPSKTLLDKLAAETEKPAEALKLLSSITVEDACELLLGENSGASPVEQDVQDRFAGLVRERGESIPVAAYAVFVTGDMASRAALVDILEQHPDGIPEAFTPETLQFALDLPNSGLLPEEG